MGASDEQKKASQKHTCVESSCEKLDVPKKKTEIEKNRDWIG